MFLSSNTQNSESIIIKNMTPKKIKVSSFNINEKIISKSAIKVIKKLDQSGYKAFLVGGCIRDLILDIRPKDFDVATDAQPQQIKRLFRNSKLIGRRFRLVHIRYGNEIIEVATFRSSSNSNKKILRDQDGRLIRDNEYGTIEEDVLRRDFRCNAIYYDVLKKRIFDFVGSVQDIRSKKLVLIGNDIDRIREDPVRMIRAVRFSTKLGFSLSDTLRKAILDNSNLLRNVPSARIFDEFIKLFMNGFAEKVYLQMIEFGLLKEIFPNLEKELNKNHSLNEMIVFALKDTDCRYKELKPISPMFLLGIFFWPSIIKYSAVVKKRKRCSEQRAIVLSSIKILNDHKENISIPRRFSSLMIDMLAMQPRMMKINRKNAKFLLKQRAFRAAYDFMIIRTKNGEVEENIAKFWTNIQLDLTMNTKERKHQ